MSYRNKLFGLFLQENVFPGAVAVTKLAKLLDVSRPTLSKLLNGRFPMSLRMAKKIADASNSSYTASDLLAKQEEFEKMKIDSLAPPKTLPNKLVVPYLQISSTRIDTWAKALDQWADTIKARSRFAVLLRILIHSTGAELESVKFPGNDDSQIPGWDGFLETSVGTPWIPSGSSGWEFGAGSDPKTKAKEDIKKRYNILVENGTSPEKLKEVTFVFVTPRKWKDKEEWRTERQNEGKWKNVRAFDATDLEQWIEQSIPAQIWLARELGIESGGTKTLAQCWKEWKGGSELESLESLFDPAVREFQEVILRKLGSEEHSPITVVGDSISECLAFLHCLFSSDEFCRQQNVLDKTVVFESASTLERLMSDKAPFVPIVVGNEVALKLAPYRSKIDSIIVYPRGRSPTETPDVTLRPLSPEQFEIALTKTEVSNDRISQLYNKSGGSLTVLPRMMSESLRLDPRRWSNDSEKVRSLIPFMFAGQWKSNNSSDKDILTSLSDEENYEHLERSINSLLNLDDSPVWKEGNHQGVISQLDAMFTVFDHITATDLNRFFSTLTQVFSIDHALEPNQTDAIDTFTIDSLNCSVELRKGLLDFFALLSIYGERLLGRRSEGNLDSQIGKVVRCVLEQSTCLRENANVDIFPELAEADPRGFLDFIEEETDREDSRIHPLISQSENKPFGDQTSAGLFRALEGLAWDPTSLMQVSSVLTKLIGSDTEDYSEKIAFRCLTTIFMSWMPQTFANVDQRIKIIRKLGERDPKPIWEFCLTQIDGSANSSMGSYKFRWRNYGQGKDSNIPANHADIRKFLKFCAEYVVNRRKLKKQEVEKLLICLKYSDMLNYIDSDLRQKIWKHIENECDRLEVSDTIWIREQIRQDFVVNSSENMVPQGNKDIDKDAQRIFDKLASTDTVLKNCWLFEDFWVTESQSELASGYDITNREILIRDLRLKAIQEIVLHKGILGISELIDLGCYSRVIGTVFRDSFKPVTNVISSLVEILKDNTPENRKKWDGFVSGLLSNPDKFDAELITNLVQNLDTPTKLYVLRRSPFIRQTWDIVDNLGVEASTKYWEEVHPLRPIQYDSDLEYALDRLNKVRRAGKAFELISSIVEKVPGKVVYRVLNNLVDDYDKFKENERLSEDDLLRAFRYLNTCEDVSDKEKAILEFHCIKIFGYEKDCVPNLDRFIEQNPSFFVQAIAFGYRRADEGKDPEAMRPNGRMEAMHRSKQAYLLLEKICPFPSRGTKQREITKFEGNDKSKITDWVNYVRKECQKLDRQEVGDYEIGKYLAKLPQGKDGIWPIETFRSEVEANMTKPMQSGAAVGLYNSLGLYAAGRGGEKEHELAQMYKEQADKVREDFSKIARVLDEVAEMYQKNGKHFDLEETAMQRMRIM